jgi:hypothetical protein
VPKSPHHHGPAKHQQGQTFNAGPVERGFVRFVSQESKVTVDVLLGNGPAQITGGVGGWDVEERFGLPPVPVWTAPEALTQTIPVLFLGSGAEAGIRRMRSLGAPRGHRQRPPLVQIIGKGLHETRLDWVVTGLDADDDVRRYGDAARREWQPMVVTLLHHPSFKAVRSSPAKRNKDKGKGGGRGGRPDHYTVRPGDTLAKIAKRVYGDAAKWKKIAQANGIRDPRGADLKDGRRLKIP